MVKAVGSHLAHLSDPRKKKYAHEIRDSNGNPIFSGFNGSLGEPSSVFTPVGMESADVAGVGEMIAQQSTIDRGGAGVTTYGWKMFENELEDRILREKDSLLVLQKLLEGLRSAARENPQAVADLLRAHPDVTDALQASMPDGVAPAWGGGAPGGGFGGGDGGGAV